MIAAQSKKSAPRQRAEGLNTAGGVLFLMQPDSKEADQAFHEAIAADPTYAAPHLNLGILCQQRGDYAAAQRWYESFLKLASDGANLSVVRVRLQEVQARLARMQDPAGKRGVEYHAILSRVQDMIEQGRLVAAMQHLDEADRLDAGRWETEAVRAAIYVRSEDWQKAEQAMKLAYDRAPEDRRSSLERASREISQQRGNTVGR